MAPAPEYPRLTRDAVRAVDRIAVERFGMPSLLLMENAGRALLEAAWEMLGGTPVPVAILCGGGNNGGDGLALARHLHNRGCNVHLLCTRPLEELEGDAAVQAEIVQKMKLGVRPASAEAIRQTQASLLVDALLGTGLKSPPREDAAGLIAAVNASAARVLAVDIPSGLDCDTGKPLGAACVRAEVTVTFVAEKAGFTNAGKWVGRVVIGDIGCPREAVKAAIEAT